MNITDISKIEPYIRPGYTWDDFCENVGHPSDTGMGGTTRWTWNLQELLQNEMRRVPERP